MPFFAPNNIQKFTPTKAKVSDLYKSISKGSNMPDSVKASTIKALKAAGYDSTKISKIINSDEPLPVAKLKQVAKDFKTGKVPGFADKDPNIVVKQYLNKQRVKAQSLAQIRKEHILEALAEDLNTKPKPKLPGSGMSNRVNLPF